MGNLLSIFRAPLLVRQNWPEMWKKKVDTEILSDQRKETNLFASPHSFIIQ
jgi:hypothetical protein